MATETAPGALEQLPSTSVSDSGAKDRIARLVAVVTGLLGTLLALATPLLPVDQTTAKLNWPQNGTFSSVEAPLISYVATDLEVTIPVRRPPGWPTRR